MDAPTEAEAAVEAAERALLAASAERIALESALASARAEVGKGGASSESVRRAESAGYWAAVAMAQTPVGMEAVQRAADAAIARQGLDATAAEFVPEAGAGAGGGGSRRRGQRAGKGRYRPERLPGVRARQRMAEAGAIEARSGGWDKAIRDERKRVTKNGLRPGHRPWEFY
jgi:hypothetical protein